MAAAPRFVSALFRNVENLPAHKPQIRVPECPRRLPHHHPEGKWLFLTWHLHGSLPRRSTLPGSRRERLSSGWIGASIRHAVVPGIWPRSPSSLCWPHRRGLAYCRDIMNWALCHHGQPCPRFAVAESLAIAPDAVTEGVHGSAVQPGPGTHGSAVQPGPGTHGRGFPGKPGPAPLGCAMKAEFRPRARAVMPPVPHPLGSTRFKSWTKFPGIVGAVPALRQPFRPFGIPAGSSLTIVMDLLVLFRQNCP